METWLKNQCNFNYRSQSFKLSLTVKSLFTGRKQAQHETTQCLISNDVIKHQQLKDPWKKDAEKSSKIWRQLSMNSFRKRREKSQRDKSKPIIAEVLKTYDKRNKETVKSWL